MAYKSSKIFFTISFLKPKVNLVLSSAPSPQTSIGLRRADFGFRLIAEVRLPIAALAPLTPLEVRHPAFCEALKIVYQ